MLTGMATQSIIAAALAKFAGLTAANFPGQVRAPVAFDEMPRKDATGAALDPETGYVVLKDMGQKPTLLGFERQTQEVAEFVFEVFYPALGDCDAAVLAIKRNGGTSDDALGFDFGTLDALTAPRTPMVCLRTLEKRSKEQGYGATGKLIHCCRLHYSVAVLEDA